ncbi:Bifunctional transcriptional activator/DNA repair enzyme Ada [Sinobacterium norvegicum]|uniref:Bifunctional transcriptional activator/DNA repair enzyme Ada n=1 Tax=Sinobacterium norvegicum TaxID=1641715 RepID=A0ABM9AIP3_9GAMM|nr:methylated-DNA--[protein]-cysteine S-methyltransferase [Sinobacterium norvegicum]CAH0993102.1 Bifunctional transcriptional activator/DNA repair enzyme Ada [Sinobacterium norvegicum]
MNPQHRNYQRVAAAISYLQQHVIEQPSLEQLAEVVHLSPFHFQRLFSDWAGVSPKKYLQYLSVEYAKGLLAEQHSLFETAYQTGLSGTGRLHDLFVSIEAMTPGEFKRGGLDLAIDYDFVATGFGRVLVASTSKGVCYLAFVDEAIEEDSQAVDKLRQRYPTARLEARQTALQQQAVAAISQLSQPGQQPLKLHLSGTPFQLKVWQALLKIPLGQLTSYGSIANEINRSSAARAVGTAIGANPVALLIPCHRVIQQSGVSGSYRWGGERKAALIGWEAACLGSD